jgi:predicted dehydrogenase
MQELVAVVVATPDHWHCPITIDAMNADKDVYVEKPLSLRIDEGPDVVKAARINERVCQVGMQRHSGDAYLFAKKELIDTGKLGKLLIFRCWWYNNPVHILTAPAALRAKPANLDWARYLGQVKWRDWDPQQYWCFRAYLDFGGGQITDLFTHWIDVLQWYTGENAPCAATAVGGIYTYKDGRTAPDTIHAALEYPGGYVATFDGALAAGERGSGGELIGTGGRLLFGTRQMEFHPAEKGAPALIKDFPEDPTAAHVRDFLECMRTRKQPVADVLVGHRAARSAHLCNIAYREQKRIRFDPVGEEIIL